MENFNLLRQEYIGEIEKMPYGEAVLVLPNGALQRQVKLQSMIECIGIDKLATKVVNQSREGQDFDLLSRQAQELLVDHLLHEHKDELLYFGPLIGKKGLVKELTTLFTEFRRCGVKTWEELAEVFEIWQEASSDTDEDYKPLVEAPSEKNHDVLLLFTVYLDWIMNSEHKAYDVEGQYMLALEVAAKDNFKRPYKKIYISDFDQLDPIQVELVNALHCEGKRTWESFGEFRDYRKNYIGDKGNDYPAWQKVTCGQYASHREEMEGVLREIKGRIDRGEAASDFMVVVKRLESFPGTRFMAEKFGILVTLPHMDKLAQHPLTQLVLDNLGEGNTLADFVANVNNFLDGLNLEAEFGKKYKAKQVDLFTLQNVFTARNALRKSLETLGKTMKVCSFISDKMTKEKFIGYWQEIIRTVDYATVQGESDGVMISEAINAIGFPHKNLYVLGVNEGEWPSPLKENWIYTDLERRSMKFDMGLIMPTAADSYEGDYYFFRRLLTMGTEQVHFSWVKDDDMDKSFYVDEIIKQFGIKDIDDNRRIYYDPVCITDDENLLDELAVVDVNRKADDSLYNGKLAPVWQENDIVKMSATQMEKYLKCPFSYMADRVWHQMKIEHKPDEIDQLEIGILVHSIIHDFYIKLRDDYGDGEHLVKVTDPGVPDKDELLKILRGIFDERANILVQEKHLHLRGNKVSELMKNDLNNKFKILRRWFETEWQEQTSSPAVRPLGTELDFKDFLLLPDVKPQVLFSGIIDRVDGVYKTVSDSEADGKPKQVLRALYVTDYKSGKTPVKKYSIQLPLYANKQVLSKMFNIDVSNMIVAGSYWSLKLGTEKREGFLLKGNKGKFEKIDEELKKENIVDKANDESEEVEIELKGKIKSCIDGIRQGNFGVPKDKKDASCRSCELKSVCRQRVVVTEEGEE